MIYNTLSWEKIWNRKDCIMMESTRGYSGECGGFRINVPWQSSPCSHHLSTKLSELDLCPLVGTFHNAWLARVIFIFILEHYSNDSINIICIAGLKSWWSWNMIRLYVINIYSHFSDQRNVRHTNTTAGSTVRTSYIICGAQWQFPVFKTH